LTRRIGRLLLTLLRRAAWFARLPLLAGGVLLLRATLL
jgi:hypothetical protein